MEQWGLMKSDAFVLIVGAVFQEIEPMIKQVNAARKISVGKRQAFCGKLYDQSVIILQSGVGMLNAVQAVTAVIEKMPVHLIINTGCAGTFPDAGIAMGDIGIATQEIDIHSGIEGRSPEDPVDQLPIPLIQTEREQYYGTYPVSAHYCKVAYDILLNALTPKNILVKQVPFITVSTITASLKRANHLFAAYQAGMENMEGAGIAHVALHYHKSFLEIRSASNFVGERNKDKWQLKKAFERSTRAVLIFLENYHLQ